MTNDNILNQENSHELNKNMERYVNSFGKHIDSNYEYCVCGSLKHKHAASCNNKKCFHKYSVPSL